VFYCHSIINHGAFTMSASTSNTDQAHKTLYEEGLKVRTEVTGQAHVERSLASVTPFTQPMIQYVTESAWGSIWTRPGLDRKTRSFLNLAMLSALGKPNELGVHVRGAINNGATEQEIQEVLLQVAAYCGAPVGMDAARVADKVLKEIREEKQAQGQ
jgi:4-carboxymuconolactone decarboxylase